MVIQSLRKTNIDESALTSLSEDFQFSNRLDFACCDIGHSQLDNCIRINMPKTEIDFLRIYSKRTENQQREILIFFISKPTIIVSITTCASQV
jgi:hypothetical protein